MESYRLVLTLLSDATFGRGDGVAGLVDAEVEHDTYGLPYLRGRTLKGLLGEECANILFSLSQGAPEQVTRWQTAAQLLFGRPGSEEETGASLHIGDAHLPDELRVAIAADLNADKPAYTASDVLDSLTAIRRQTAMDPSGRPEDHSLRTMRVILRDTSFEADVSFYEEPSQDALALLTAAAAGLRRAGMGRNRGRGRVAVRLHDAQGQDISKMWLDYFRQEVQK